MGNVPEKDELIAAVRPLVEAGVAVHWLHRRSKRPIGHDWQKAPVATLESLIESYRSGYNVGVRPGEFSKTPYGYLHLIDLDIRKPEFAEEAWACLLKFWPEARSAPFVISGSGGESRHIYLFTDKPFRSLTFGKSEGREMIFDANKGRDVQKWDWECGLYGAPKQAVLPPSVHPDSGENYVWGREIEWDMLEMGIGPIVPSSVVAGWGANDDLNLDEDDDLLAIAKSAPMGLSQEEIDDILDAIPNDDLHHDDYVQVGMALHHEYEGSQLGFERWCEWGKQSSKFDIRTNHTKWRSFKGRANPVRMATLIKIAGDNRLAQDHAEFDDLLDDTIDEILTTVSDMPAAQLPAVIRVDADLADLLDTSPTKPITPGAPVVDKEWRSYLQRGEDGKSIKGTVHNVELIIRNDPRTQGVIAFNEFTQEIVQKGRPARFNLAKRSPKPVRQLDTHVWSLRDEVNGDLWSDTHDNDLRIILEAPTRQGGYSLKTTDRDLHAAIDRVAHLNRFHPVRQYLESMEWDGVNRVERLFVDYVGAEDNAYHREAAVLWMIGAVARVFDPGHKFDFVPILEGMQGKRKSTFFNIMARHWFAELSGDFHDRKEMVEQMQGAWIMELPELQGFSKADVQMIKAFVSAQKDKVRLSYARRASEFPRQVVFGGTTNDVEYLRDATGGRRFWPIACHAIEIDTDRLELEVDQMWAEAKAMYDAWRGRYGKKARLPLYMKNPVAAAYAKEMQESRRQVGLDDTLAARIEHWVGRPINADLQAFDDEDPLDVPVYRTELCGYDVWSEMMNNDPNRYSDRDQQLIGRALRKIPGWEYAGQLNTDRWGKQRVYRKIDVDQG